MVDIKEEKTKLILTWKIPIQKLKLTKNNVDYYSYRASLPIDLKNYLEHKYLNGGKLTVVEFHKSNNNDFFIVGTNENNNNVDDDTYIGKSKLTTDKNGHLYFNLPLKIKEFKTSLKEDRDCYLKYILEYSTKYKQYLMFIKILN